GRPGDLSNRSRKPFGARRSRVQGGVTRITPVRRACGYTCAGGSGHPSPRHRQETEMIRPADGMRDLTIDEINLVSGGLAWAYEIRSADGVLDVGMKLDKA